MQGDPRVAGQLGGDLGVFVDGMAGGVPLPYLVDKGHLHVLGERVHNSPTPTTDTDFTESRVQGR